jgi:alpha-beta hydrolase superfamily lysophospholipase
VRYRHKKEKLFENNEYMGAFADVSFDIVSENEMGREALRFDTKIHYYEKGEGIPLLLVHGMGQSLYTWRRNIDFFADNGFCVIAPDMAGFGYSGHPNIYYTLRKKRLSSARFWMRSALKKRTSRAFRPAR